MMAIKQVAISVPLYTAAIRQSRCFTPSSFRYILHSWSQRSRWRSRRRHSYNQCRRRTEQLWRKERVLHLDQPFYFNEVSNWPYLDDKETVISELARNSCVFLWMGGKVWDWEGLGFAVLKKKMKRNVLWKVHSAVWHLFFWLFGFSIFISSYQVILGRLDLVWIDCRKFCALFFVCWLRSYFSCPSLLCVNLFFPKKFWIFFFPQKNLPFWNLPAGIP